MLWVQGCGKGWRVFLGEAVGGETQASRGLVSSHLSLLWASESGQELFFCPSRTAMADTASCWDEHGNLESGLPGSLPGVSRRSRMERERKSAPDLIVMFCCQLPQHLGASRKARNGKRAKQSAYSTELLLLAGWPGSTAKGSRAQERQVSHGSEWSRLCCYFLPAWFISLFFKN